MSDSNQGNSGPSQSTRAIFGAAAGAVLGAVQAILFRYFTNGQAPLPLASAWGAGIGTVGGLLFVAIEYLWKGPSAGMSLATYLGIFYGLVPGGARLYRLVFVDHVLVAGKAMAGVLMVGCAAGLLLGGALDRCFESIVGRTES